MSVGATGVQKRVAIKKEATFGTLASAGSFQILRRVTSTPNLKKNTYTSKEIRSDYQIADMRHGSRRVEGSLSGELSGGSFQPLFEALFRAAAVAGVTTGPLTDVDSSAVDNSFNRVTGSFLTDGFRVGTVIRVSGFTTTGAANNAKNLRVTSVAALKMIVAEVLTTKAAGDTVTILQPGKVLSIPLTGHTDDSFSMEEWNPTPAVSKRFVGVKPSTGSIKLPATGLATIDVNWMGQDMQKGTSAYATSPTAASTSRIVSAVDGLLRIDGSDIVVCKGINFDFNGDMSLEEVIGSNISPDVFAGSVGATGQLTALFTNDDMLDWFLNEGEATLHQTLKATSAANSDFISLYFGKVKSNANDSDDQPKAITQTVPFVPLLPDAVTGSIQSTIVMQDSLFV